MKRTPRTHREWLSSTRRVLKKSDAEDAIAAYQRIAAGVEQAMAAGINEWHLAQTWHLLSLEQARAGDHRGAAVTLRRLVDHHRALLVEHRRAYVAGAATAAVQLWKAGDVTGARRMLRTAEHVGRGLKPQEFLLKEARGVVRHRRKRAPDVDIE